MDAVVYLVRHGMHDWLRPDRNRLAGRLPGIALNDDGRGEMEQVARGLAGRRLDWIAASPVQRTVESAEVIARSHGLDVARDERFIEWAFGPWEGMWIEDIHARYPQEWRLWREDPVALRLPGAETLEQVADRMAAGCLAWMDRGAPGTASSSNPSTQACRFCEGAVGTLKEDDLFRAATVLGLTLDRERIRVLLPEVRRILEAVERLRELPLDPAVPPFPPRQP